MQQRGAAQPAGHGGVCGLGAADPGCTKGAEQQRRDRRRAGKPEEQDHQGAVGQGHGGLHQRPADRPADHPAQAGQRREPDGGAAAGQLRGRGADPEPGRCHCTGGEFTHGGRSAGHGYHGGGGAFCEELFGKAEGGAGGGDHPARGRAAGMAQAGQPARRTGEHWQGRKPCREGRGQAAKGADRVDQRDGRDHGGGTVGGQQGLCKEPPGGVQRGSSQGGERGILEGGERDLPEGDRAHTAQLHGDAAGGHPAQPRRVCEGVYHVYDPALPELRHFSRCGDGLQDPERAVQGAAERREPERGAAGRQAAEPGGGESGDADGGVCTDEDRRGLFAAPVGPGAGRKRRRDAGEYAEAVHGAIHRERGGQLFVWQRAVQRGGQCHKRQGLRRGERHEHQRGERPDERCDKMVCRVAQGYKRDDRGAAGSPRGQAAHPDL